MIFIAGNLPMKTEITPLLIVIKLEQFDYAGAAALGFIMLVMSFVMLLSINLLQAWGRRRLVGAATLMAARSRQGTARRDREPRPGRDTLVSVAHQVRRSSRMSLVFLAALLFAPLITVFATALEQGLRALLRELQGLRHARGDPPDADRRRRSSCR